MCGIIGLSWADEQLIKKLTKIIKHRGPDGTDHYVDKVSLGHNRLSIIDLSNKGSQPMTAFGKTIVFNGEIYNYKELKEGLKEYKFKSSTDTEVILALYDKYGIKSFNMLNGMYAFCIYDNDELILVRDKFGIKPLYYTTNKFAFSSEIKSLKPLIDKKLDSQAIAEYFTYRYPLGNNTIFQQIKKVLPGTYMIYSLKNKQLVIKNYYTLPKKRVKKCNPQTVNDLIKKSIERRMIADVPVATFLSGGIDSSIITYIAKKHNNNLNTFSIGFDKTNELNKARKVAKLLHTNHYEYVINKKTALKHLRDMVFSMDEPIGGDPGFLPIFVLSKEASKHNKVVLSGDGADEVYAGYDKYKLFKYGMKINKLLPHHFTNSILKKIYLMKNKSAENAYLEIVKLFDNEELKKLGIVPAKNNYFKKEFSSNIKNAQLFDLKTLLPNDFFMKADKMSSAFGLEQRVPFMDSEVVEHAFTIPENQLLNIFEEKSILRKAFESELPKFITKQRKKGFDVPVYYWFKNDLGKQLKTLLDKSTHNLYNKTYAYDLLEQIKKSSNNPKLSFYIGQKLWSILIFELWLEINEN